MSHLPVIDKYLAANVIDAALKFNFDLSNLAHPSEVDNTTNYDENEVLENNVLGAMHQEWETTIKPAVTGNYLNVYRAISIASVSSLRTTALGKYWSTNKDTAQPYWGKYKYWIVIHAIVDLKLVDWADTFALHIEGGENEVRLYSGTPVKIVGLEWKSSKNSGHLDDDDEIAQTLIGKTFTT